MTPPLQQFMFVLVGPPDPAQVARLMRGCDDATVEVGPSLAWVAFDREAPSLVDGIVSAMRDLTGAGLDPAYVRVDDDLVTLDVVGQRYASTPHASTPHAGTPHASTPGASTSDASAPHASTPGASTPHASTPETVAGWVARQDFPAPIEPHPQRPVYSWAQVAAWLEVHFGQAWPDAGLTMRAVNLALELRRIMPQIERGSGIRAVLWS